MLFIELASLLMVILCSLHGTACALECILEWKGKLLFEHFVILLTKFTKMKSFTKKIWLQSVTKAFYEKKNNTKTRKHFYFLSLRKEKLKFRFQIPLLSSEYPPEKIKLFFIQLTWTTFSASAMRATVFVASVQEGPRIKWGLCLSYIKR